MLHSDEEKNLSESEFEDTIMLQMCHHLNW